VYLIVEASLCRAEQGVCFCLAQSDHLSSALSTFIVLVRVAGLLPEDDERTLVATHISGINVSSWV